MKTQEVASKIALVLERKSRYTVVIKNGSTMSSMPSHRYPPLLGRASPSSVVPSFAG